MTNLANQLRAGAYVLGRNWRTWVAVALVVANEALRVWGVAADGVTYGLQDSVLRNRATIAILLFAAAGVAVFDSRGCALRSACAASRGRADFALSRHLLVAALAGALLALTAALDLLGGALAPGASVILASPEAHEAGRLAAGALTMLVLAELAYVVASITKSTSAMATAGGLIALYVVLVVGLLVAGPAELISVVDSLMPLEGLSADVVAGLDVHLVPLNPLRAFVVPASWIVALLALDHAFMARRTV